MSVEIWRDETTGYRCAVVARDFGPFVIRCGYVEVPREHAFHGLVYDEVYNRSPQFGDLTFSGEPDGVTVEPGGHWLGIDDNGHGDDAEMRGRVTDLAKRLAEVSS